MNFNVISQTARDYAISFIKIARTRLNLCAFVFISYTLFQGPSRLVSFRYRLRFRAVRFAAFMIYLNNWIDAHFWLCRICDCWGRREKHKRRASFIKCTCWFSFYLLHHSVNERWGRAKKLMAIKNLPKSNFNKILNWALCVENIYVVTFYVWCVSDGTRMRKK